MRLTRSLRSPRRGYLETLEPRCALAADVGQSVGTASLSGQVWVEQTGNQRFDTGDRPLAGVHLHLANTQGQVIATGQTGQQGAFRFEHVPPGIYDLIEIQPSALSQGEDLVGTSGGLGGSDNLIRDIVLQAGDDATGYDFLEQPGEGLETLVIDDAPPLMTEGNIVPSPQPSPAGVTPPVAQPSEPSTPTTTIVALQALSLPSRPQVATALDRPPLPVIPSPGSSPANIEPVADVRPTEVLIGGGKGRATWQLSLLHRSDVEETESELVVSHSASPKRTPRAVLDQASWLLPRLTGEQITVQEIVFGIPGGTPVVGDFDADGESDLGIYLDGKWYVRSLSGTQLLGKLGSGSDYPVVGDWDGNGRTDIGVCTSISQSQAASPVAQKEVRHTTADSNRQRTSSVGNASRPLPAKLVDRVLRYGAPGDQPIAGDWTGHGAASIGVFRDGRWRLDLDRDGKISAGDAEFIFGQIGDQPVVGDFNGDGRDDIGVFRDGLWILDSNGNRQIDSQDYRLQFGERGDRPVVGDWDGDGTDEPGLYRALSGSLSEAGKAIQELPTLHWLSGGE